jgi:hypothetical protein
MNTSQCYAICTLRVLFVTTADIQGEWEVPVQVFKKGVVLCWKWGHPIHKTLEVAYLTPSLASGGTSNSFCNHKYCIFTATSTLTYVMCDLRDMPVGVTYIPYCNWKYTNFISVCCTLVLCEAPSKLMIFCEINHCIGTSYVTQNNTSLRFYKHVIHSTIL